MAKYRPVFTKIWDDPDFKEYGQKEKLIFIYLCTNPLTTESGIYAISCKTVSQATGLILKEVTKALTNNRIKNVLYDTEKKVVFVCNFFRYNGKGRPDLVAKSILNDIKYIKTSLWKEFAERYPLYYEKLLTLAKDLGKCSIPNPTPNPIPKPTSNLTTYSTDGESLNINSENKKIPVEEMMAVFIKHWQKHNKGHYTTTNNQKEKEVAERLWLWCIKDLPDNPLRVFERKVERLYEKFNIKCFSGLECYWNFAAGEKKPKSWIES